MANRVIALSGSKRNLLEMAYHVTVKGQVVSKRVIDAIDENTTCVVAQIVEAA